MHPRRIRRHLDPTAQRWWCTSSTATPRSCEIDGTEESVRFLGIDTPEIAHPDQPEECFGPEATARTEALIPPGTEVRLERDLEARDRFDRLLAYVYRAEDDLFVNESLVGDGFADTLSIEPNRAHDATFAAARAEARAADRGLWSRCPT